MRFINILLVTLITITMLALMGCPPKQAADQPGPSGDSDPTAVQDDNGDTDIDVDRDTDADDEDAETITYEDEEGEISWTADGETVTIVDEGDGTTVISQAGLPEGWPDDIPIMDGFEAQGSVETQNIKDDENFLVVSAEGSAELKDVLEFYENLPGWSKEEGGMVMMSDVFAMTTLSKGDAVLTIQVSQDEEEDKTIIVLMYMPEGQQ